MHGNVCEWCDDAEKPGDVASLRVYRGGGWVHDAGNCRAALRLTHEPVYRVAGWACIGPRFRGVKESR